MRKRKICRLRRVFQPRLAGNPLAVVFEPDGLDDAAMQAIAGEFNLSETMFILPPQEQAHRANVRIFTPMHELPFAGHPTVGAAIAITEAAGGDGAVDLRAGGEGRAGALRRVEAARTACSPNSTCRGCPSRWRFPADPAAVAASLGLDAARDRLREPRRVSLFRRRALHPGAGRRARRGGQGRPRHARLDGADRAGRGAVAGRLRLLPRDGRAPATPSMRACSPGISASRKTRRPARRWPPSPARSCVSTAPVDGVSRYPIEQGVEMGRPSLIRLELDVRQGAWPARASAATPSRSARACCWSESCLPDAPECRSAGGGQGGGQRLYRAGRCKAAVGA